MSNTGICNKHYDENLPAGEYIVKLTTDGGSCIVNGKPGFIVELPRPFSRSDEFISYRDVIRSIEKSGGEIKWVNN